MRRLPLLAICLLAATASLAVAAPAAPASIDCDRVAAPNGSDSAPGTIAAPYKSARKLVDSLHSGQTGCFRSGTYGWSGDLSIDTANVTVTSYPDERATLAGRLRVEATADDSVVENLTLNGQNADNSLSPLIYADGVALRGNDITNSTICISVDDYPGYPAPRGVVIEGNRIHDCGVSDNHQHGVYLAGATDAVIRDNWIYDNADRGIQLYPNADGTRITGNVIDGNGEGIIFSGTGSQTSDNNVVTGNVITNSTIRHNIESYWGGPVGTGNVVRENCLWTTRSSYLGSPTRSGMQDPYGFTAADNVVTDPLYVDRAAGNYELREGSSCRAVLGGQPPAGPQPESPPPPPSEPDAPESKPKPKPDKGTAVKRGTIRLRSSVAAVECNETILLRGRVRSNARSAGTRALIQGRLAGGWTRLATTRLASGRRFAVDVPAGEEPGTLRLRAKVKGVGHSRSLGVGVLG